MRSKALLLILMVPAFAFGQVYKKHSLLNGRLSIQLSEGTMNIVPLSEKAVRVQWEKGSMKEERELVLINKLPAPVVKFSETATKLKLSTNTITVLFDKQTGAIDYSDNTGKVFLSEKAGSRKLLPDTIAGQDCFVAEQGFDSPVDEFLFGLGQFQDGQYNLRNISRKLIQVNSQIAIPFLYSSRGFGILWHQYGITHFNPADNVVVLAKKDTASGERGDVEVTTTSGTQRVSRQQSLYTGKFTVPATGNYSMMLDPVLINPINGFLLPPASW
jgi:alpha-D-xyloside xylohydrolase